MAKKVAAQPEQNDQGQLLCPIHKCPMVPMSSGKGFRCGTPGNIWRNGRWTKCSHSVFNKGSGGGFKPQRKPVERAASWPVIAKPTPGQVSVRTLLGLAPKARPEKSRCVVINAGPGTAKTTTSGWSLQAVYQRLGSLFGYGVRAFNVNAADVMRTKLPAQVPDVGTLHSSLKAAQGHSGMATTGKINAAFRSLVEHIPYDRRPSPGKIKKVLESARALCLYARADDRTRWAEIIGTVAVRFPGLGKKMAGQEEFLLDYCPQVAQICLSDARKIDFSDMVTRPVQLALAALDREGFQFPSRLATTGAAEWTDEDVRTFCTVIKRIDLPPVTGLVVDEAQDLDLSQIACILAQTFRSGELVLVGDDREGNPGEPGWKAGQAIYGWRGAFSGSLTLIRRLWRELTGETPAERALDVTFRHGPEICESYRPLNSTIRSIHPKGYSRAGMTDYDHAFEAWCAVPAGKSALWITRTNQEAASVFLSTLRAHEDCNLRGGTDFAGSVDSALYDAAGWCGDDGEYKTTLKAALAKLRQIQAENEGPEDPNSMESFLLQVGEEISKNPALLSKAALPPVPTVGNLRRFVLHFASKDSRRSVANVYRCKGDEADLTVVSDAGRFNESWGNPHEDDACRHVALSRAKRLSLTVGLIAGSELPILTIEQFEAALDWFLAL